MTCERVRLPGGGIAIVCTRGRPKPKPCVACGAPSVKLCDHPAPRKKSGTCDAALCARHAKSIGEDRDLCPSHALEVENAERAARPPLRTTTLHVWTARISTSDPDLLNITRAGVDAARKAQVEAPGAPWAPSWGILTPALAAREKARQLRDLAQHEPGLGWSEQADRVEARAWALYRPAFLAEMLVSSEQPIPDGWAEQVLHAQRRGVTPARAAWVSLLARSRAVLICYCTGSHCHRFLVANILQRLGAVYEGELPAPAAPASAPAAARPPLAHVRGFQ